LLAAAIAMPALLMSSNGYADDAVVTTSSAAPTPAAEPAVGANKPSVITRPDWRTIPTGQQIAGVFPERAIRQHVDGRAVIRCTVMASGKVGKCQIVSESPEGYGFGDAVLKLSKYFVMRPQTVDGAPVEGAVINIPVVFRQN
jgi:protein TonB